MVKRISRRKRNVTHGYLVADKGVYAELKSAAAKIGWGVKSIPQGEMDNVSDEKIAEKYGKGRNFLLTYDKTAYTHNIENGFVGYIEYDEIPSKEEFMEFVENFTIFMSQFKTKDFIGKRIILTKEGYNVEKLSQVKLKTKSK